MAPARHWINISIVITGPGTLISFSYELDEGGGERKETSFLHPWIVSVLTYTSCNTKEVLEGAGEWAQSLPGTAAGAGAAPPSHPWVICYLPFGGFGWKRLEFGK